MYLLCIAALADPWNDTIDEVLDSVVIIHMDRTRPFDGNAQSSSQASGFVIDAERGLVLTNRHVVTTGPSVAQAIFHNKEEVDLIPLYADPVHDFGLYRYDPAELEFISPSSLQLAPELARVGSEIRVIGNDAAEQISILAGTLSRIDRDAPHWDFNTFYLQAASSTSGGSSGSPVFDVKGRVIALNAGARNDAATSLFLPLQRVVRAIEALKRGEVPTRGTVQAILTYQTFDELGRLGLSKDQERAARKVWDGTGLLTVGRVNPGGPSDGKLEEGDIVRAIAGEPLYEFVAWESALDDAVGGTVSLDVLRGGKQVTVELEVQDLHGLTPSRYLEIGEGILHDLGYHTAVRVPRPVDGVGVGRSGRLFAAAGIGTNAIIDRIGETPIHSVDDAADALAQVPDGQTISVGYTRRDDPTSHQVTTVLMNRAFWPVRTCERVEGRWPCELQPEPPAAGAPSVFDVALAVEKKSKYRAAAQSIVTVTFRPLLNLDTIHGDQRKSAGILLDPAEGLVLTDRYAIPATTGEVRVRVGDAPSVPATILYVSPIHNVALVKADVSRLALPEMQPIELTPETVEVGAKLQLVALDKEGRVYRDGVDVDRLMPASFRAPRYPKFMERDVDFLRLGQLDRPTLGGVLLDKKGRIVGLLQRFGRDEGNRLKKSLYAVETHTALEALDRWKRGVKTVPSLGIDLTVGPLVDAREAGLPDPIAAKIRLAAPDRPQVLEVRKISGDAPAHGVLEAGDAIVAAGDTTVTDFAGLERVVNTATGSVALTVVRRGKVLSLEVEPLALSVTGTERVLLWAGALVQEEHPEVALYAQTPADGVYLSWYYGGSPAQRYGTGYGRRILAVDGVEVDSLDAFLEVVKGRADRSSVRLRMQGLRGEEWVITLKLDLQYWPTQEFRRVDGVWTRTELE